MDYSYSDMDETCLRQLADYEQWKANYTAELISGNLTTVMDGNFSLNMERAAVLAGVYPDCPFSNYAGYDEPPDDTVLQVVMQFVYCIICVLGLIGNSLVIYVVLRYTRMKTVTNMYILNLAVADDMFVIGIPLLMYTVNEGHWMFGYTLCKIYMISACVNQFTSASFLLVMSGDRYLAVCHPVRSMGLRTPRNAVVVCCITWAMSVLLMVPIIMYSAPIVDSFGPMEPINETFHTNITLVVDDKYTCMVKWPEKGGIDPEKAFTLYSLFLGFVGPLFFTSIFYVLVICKIRTMGPKGHKSKEKKKSQRKVTVMVLTVVTVYVLCWLPYWCLQVALVFNEGAQMDMSAQIYIVLFIYSLAYANSAMNPILYAFLSDTFRQSFLQVCWCPRWLLAASREPLGVTNAASRTCLTETNGTPAQADMRRVRLAQQQHKQQQEKQKQQEEAQQQHFKEQHQDVPLLSSNGRQVKGNGSVVQETLCLVENTAAVTDSTPENKMAETDFRDADSLSESHSDML